MELLRVRFHALTALAVLAASALPIRALGADALTKPELRLPPEKRSVYDVSLAVDGPVIAVSGIIGLTSVINGSQWIRQRCPCNPDEVNGWDRGVIGNRNIFLDTTSDVTVGLVLAFPIVGDALDLGVGKEFWEDMTIYAETLAVNGALVSLTKYTVQRPLPRTYAGEYDLVHSGRGYTAFYSGHVSTTFAALSSTAMTLNLRHNAGLWPWILTVGVGLMVAAERVAAGQHFYSDVTIGALTGAAVGTLIPLLHEKKTQAEYLSLEPHDLGLALTMNWRLQ